ncbi:MAG TPA: SpoIIE family protein phosphatase [Bryobacteraceae bacterium]|nr:SpoIIE family protein phosphatase [Bryobacteraceae bacterium]
MQPLKSVKGAWGAVRWKMLIIFVFFSITSMFLVACFSVAVLNVVIRRESPYFIEERINGIVDNHRRLASFLLAQVQGCNLPASDSPLFTDYSSGVWPGAETLITVLPKGAINRAKPKWLDSDSFAGVVVDQGHLEIRSFRTAERPGCSVTLLERIPIGNSFLKQLASVLGLQVSGSKQKMLRRYGAHEEIFHDIEANFVPGSSRPVSAVVTARNWQTGLFEDWELCQVRPSYSRTVENLSHMGMQTATWVSLLGAIALALVILYALGLLLSVRLSQRIVAVIDDLTHGAIQIGKGDFSVRLAVPGHDQLGMLASSFNDMTRDLETLRQQEKQNAILERDIALAHEVQQYLYPRVPPVLSGAKVWGVTAPARMVSGDLFDFLSFSKSEVGLLCADISGKGVSAALMMAQLQALAHGRLLPLNENRTRPRPDAFMTALNGDLQGRFGNNRYATMFYGEYDSESKVLRYINAGHCPPLLISEAGEVTKLTGGDLPVGLFPEIRYQELQVTLSTGSAFVVYTDGVTDALNSQGEEFGEQRLLSCCSSLPKGANAETICMLLSTRVAEWAAGVVQFDDTTILVLSAE